MRKTLAKKKASTAQRSSRKLISAHTLQAIAGNSDTMFQINQNLNKDDVSNSLKAAVKFMKTISDGQYQLSLSIQPVSDVISDGTKA